MLHIYIYNISSLRVNDLAFILLTWRKWLAPNNASRQQMGFNSGFKGLRVRTHQQSRVESFQSSQTHKDAANTLWLTCNGRRVSVYTPAESSRVGSSHTIHPRLRIGCKMLGATLLEVSCSKFGNLGPVMDSNLDLFSPKVFSHKTFSLR